MLCINFYANTENRTQNIVFYYIPVNNTPFELHVFWRAFVAHFIAGHEHTQLSPVCFFISLVYSLLLKDLTIENLFIFIAAGVAPCGGRKTSPHTSS